MLYNQIDEGDAALRQWQADRPLSEKLKVPRGEPFDPIPAVLLRKVKRIRWFLYHLLDHVASLWVWRLINLMSWQCHYNVSGLCCTFHLPMYTDQTSRNIKTPITMFICHRICHIYSYCNISQCTMEEICQSIICKPFFMDVNFISWIDIMVVVVCTLVACVLAINSTSSRCHVCKTGSTYTKEDNKNVDSYLPLCNVGAAWCSMCNSWRTRIEPVAACVVTMT